jgi:hypothetical protein
VVFNEGILAKYLLYLRIILQSAHNPFSLLRS